MWYILRIVAYHYLLESGSLGCEWMHFDLDMPKIVNVAQNHWAKDVPFWATHPGYNGAIERAHAGHYCRYHIPDVEVVSTIFYFFAPFYFYPFPMLLTHIFCEINQKEREICSYLEWELTTANPCFPVSKPLSGKISANKGHLIDRKSVV